MSLNLKVVIRVARWRVCRRFFASEIDSNSKSASNDSCLVETKFEDSQFINQITSICRSFLERKALFRKVFLAKVEEANAAMVVFSTERRISESISSKRDCEEIAVLFAMTNHHLVSTKMMPGVLASVDSPYLGLSMDDLSIKLRNIRLSLNEISFSQTLPLFTYHDNSQNPFA